MYTVILLIFLGLCGTENVNSLNSIKDQEESTCIELPSWQEEIFKLTKAPKPLIIERFPKLTTKSPQSNVPGHTLKSQPIGNIKQKNGCTSHFTTVQTGDEDDVEVCSKKDNCYEIENNCEPGSVSSKKLKESEMPVTRDIQNIVASNYPVIDKVVADDIILFQVLKLNELNEPEISNRILAKVKSSTNFPNQIFLHIIEGSEECGGSSRTEINNEEDTVEFQWTDLIEPRLLYP